MLLITWQSAPWGRSINLFCGWFPGFVQQFVLASSSVFFPPSLNHLLSCPPAADGAFLARQRAKADAEFYTAQRAAEANKVR